MARHWVTKIGIIQKEFEDIFQKFVQGRQIDVRKGMPSFASIPVTIRTLFKTNRPGDGEGVGSDPSPQAFAG